MRRYRQSLLLYYGPSVISITVIKGGHLKGNRLYKTSRTIRRRVTKSGKRKLSIYRSSERRNVSTQYI